MPGSEPGKESPAIVKRPLDYVSRLRARTPGDVDLVVIHATELPDLETAREYGERIQHAQSGTGNSGHFYIDRDGRVEEWVPVERVAHHVRGFNEHSLGIELVNRGRFPDWFDSAGQDWPEIYPDAQIEALIGLLDHLKRELPGLTRITGHDRLDTDHVPASDDPDKTVRRKTDPGPAFPWPRILEATGLEFLAGSDGD